MLKPKYTLEDPKTEIYVGDCRLILPQLPKGSVDLIFADPPFNWEVDYGKWNDKMPREEYLDFTRAWLDACIEVLSPHGAFWVNIPDDTAAEIAVHLKSRHLMMINWCVWHFRFGQCRSTNFIVSKVHVLYFAKNPKKRIWNPQNILEPSDRSTMYADHRTRETRNPGMRVPLDVWYGQYWGRIQGNNKERRNSHKNQIPEVYLTRVIKACSNENDLVLDPFLGSGTTCTVARDLGRRSIGIEYCADIAKLAFQRVQNGPVRREDLFDKVIEKAFFAVHRGLSTDEVIIDNELREHFLLKCQNELQSLGQKHPGEYKCLWQMENLRKSGRLGNVTKTRRITNRAEFERANSILKDIKTAMGNIPLDRILCDPEQRDRFDTLASTIAPDLPSYLVRKAALNARKQGKW